MNRRRFVTSAGMILAVSLGGCVQDGDSDGEENDAGNDGGTDGSENGGDDETDGNNGSENGDNDGDGGTSDGDDGTGDSDDMSIDGRLHNEDDQVNTFSTTIRDESGETLTENEWEVDPETTRRVPALGRPGTTRTIEVTVDGVKDTETLEFDVEGTPGAVDGYVDIWYKKGIVVEISFTPTDSEPGGEPDPERVDEPPHEITEPDRENWNEEYLGTNMATEPSLEFEVLTRERGVIAPEAVPYPDADGAYWVTTIANESDREELLDVDAVDEETRERIRSVDFEERLLIAVETGYGSGSIEHRWARVEHDNGLSLHGYLTAPRGGTSDITTWVSLIEIQRPDGEIDPARVYLTVDDDRRVTFDSTEGAVTLDS